MFEIAGAVTENLSQNTKVLYAANECCCYFFALNTCLFT